MELTEERVKRYLTEVHGYLELASIDDDSGMCAPDLLDIAQARLDALADSPFEETEIAFAQGSIYRERHTYGKAVPFFCKVLESEPGHPAATIGLGWCLKRTGRLAEAIAPYVESLQSHPKMAILHYNLACYLSLLGRTAESLTALEQAFKIDEDFRKLAKTESDFDPISTLPEFQRLIRD
jgi:tetratricopeptide (TPR) repeat protein